MFSLDVLETSVTMTSIIAPPSLHAKVRCYADLLDSSRSQSQPNPARIASSITHRGLLKLNSLQCTVQ